MPQHNNENEEALKKHRHTFAPAAAVWGQMGRLWTDIARTSRTAETITTADYVAFFYQYLGYTDDTVLAPIAQEQCRCCAYFHESDHIVKVCTAPALLPPSRNWYLAHQHLGQAVLRVLFASGYSASKKNALTSEGQRRADIEVFNIGLRSGIYCSISLSAMISSGATPRWSPPWAPASSGPAR